jgi:hypothetical protein
MKNAMGFVKIIHDEIHGIGTFLLSVPDRKIMEYILLCYLT